MLKFELQKAADKLKMCIRDSYYPILLKGTCYGVISLVAFNEQQRENIMKNSFSFMKFTRKMAEILASKVQELIVREELSSTNEYLKTIISSRCV